MQGGNLQDYLRSNRSLQRAAYANTCSDVKTLTNNDLMTFAYQVSSGMQFLSSNGCIHRDLAARKVLLDKQNICKISNFRLTREVDNKHQKDCKIKSNLPVPWIALESIRNGIFTTKSNVWSFGVVLWEIVTMGNRPYPGMSEQEVTSSLQAGYRMPKPSHCEKELYSIILSCWDEDMGRRPTFAELSAILQKLTNDEKTYIEITDIDLVDDN
ncbi:tyrosine kinase receptor Cad96Ca-like [Ptychodera flava]|uniref:tyrosine kinase receptor Cad96Ca-like n=1 Tax=Ptychodera flava TaxID=63121 RepID=UPI003969FF37